MLAMQYTIELPDNFNPSQIRERVRERSSLFDSSPGLAHKSFLFNETDQLYAPFYVWSNAGAACEFLLDDLFKGVINSFSRPRVRTWNIIQTGHGNRSVIPTFAMREADAIPAEECLQELATREREKQQALLKNSNLYFHAIALDAERWELVRYSVWRDARSADQPESDCVQTYDVLHVSEEEMAPRKASA